MAGAGASPFRSKRMLFAGLAGAIVLLLYVFHASSPSSSSSSSAFSLSHSSPYGNSPGRAMPGADDRMTLVVVWNSLDKPTYMDMFLRSIEANHDRVDLLIVMKREDKPDGKCADFGNVGKNIKSICFSNLEYWSLHRDYFCERWHCTPEQSFDLFNNLVHRGIMDYIHSHFRILRGPLFRSHFIDPNTKYWGWCDADTVMGNFNRQFPWDVAQNFDLLQPTHPSDGKEALVYMRGHLTVFQNRESTTSKLMSFPIWKDVNTFMNSPPATQVTEEEDFSTFVFYQNPSVTFLTFDALVTGHFHAGSLSPRLWTFMHRDPIDWSLPLPLPPSPQPPTFSADPLMDHQVRLEVGKTKEDIWMPLEGAVSYLKGVPKDGKQGKRFLMRKREDGSVRERIEDWARWEMVGAQPEFREGLYLHLQMEKRLPWFATLPPHPLGKGRILSMGGFDDAEIRSTSGKQIWEAAKAPAAEPGA